MHLGRRGQKRNFPPKGSETHFQQNWPLREDEGTKFWTEMGLVLDGQQSPSHQEAELKKVQPNGKGELAQLFANDVNYHHGLRINKV